MDKDGYHGYDKPSMKVEGPRHVVCQCDKCKTENQEPVGRFAKFTDGIWREVTDYSAGVPLYTRPQPRKPLTDEQIDEIADTVANMPLVGIVNDFRTRFARAIEAAHGIKENT